MNIWLVDHLGFFNRGCEAIVRSTIAMVRSRLPACRFTLWSNDPQGDREELVGEEVEVRDAAALPLLTWEPPYRFYGALKRRGWPGARIARAVVRRWPSVPRCVLSVGGDNFTLDYGRPDHRVDVGRFFLDLGVPYVIWGASVGPFTADPEFEKVMRDFLPQVDLITARESLTVEYLRRLDVTSRVVRVWDPAFALEPEPYDGPEAAFVASGDVLGLNVSALIAKRFPGNDVESMLDEVGRFLEEVTGGGTPVLLIPHVSSKQGRISRSDETVLQMLRGRLGEGSGRVTILPGGVPSRRVKWLISRCRFFIGARTHSTIAALSSGVPTVAIAYSRKALGIFADVFGNNDYVVSSSSLSARTLSDAWTRLRRDEAAIRQLLRQKQPEMREGAQRGAESLAELLGGRRTSRVRPCPAAATCATDARAAP